MFTQRISSPVGEHYNEIVYYRETKTVCPTLRFPRILLDITAGGSRREMDRLLQTQEKGTLDEPTVKPESIWLSSTHRSPKLRY